MYRYRSDPSVFNVDVTGGYSYQGFPDGQLTRIRSNGIMAYGMLPTPTFLYSSLLKLQSYGLAARFEALRDLFIDFHLNRSRSTNEVPDMGQDYANKTDFLPGIRYNYH